MSETKSIKELIDQLLHCNINASKRAEAAKELEYQIRSAIPALIERLKDPNNEVCGNCARALGEIGNKKAAQPVMGVLTDSDKCHRDNYVLCAAIWALGELGDPQAVSVVEKFSTHADQGVRSAASDALKKLDKPR